MKTLFIILIPLVAGDLYKETQNFQYSRTSGDEEKKGFYGSQSGNMPGNFEDSHNMDGLAQHQMKGLMDSVGSQLGIDPAAIGTGAVGAGSLYGSASSRGNSYGVQKGVGSGYQGYREAAGRDGASIGRSEYGNRASHTSNTYGEYAGSESQNSRRIQAGSRLTGSAGQDTAGARWVGGSSHNSGGSRYHAASTANDYETNVGETDDSYNVAQRTYVPVAVEDDSLAAASQTAASQASGSRYHTASTYDRSQAEYDEGQRTVSAGRPLVVSGGRPLVVRPGTVIRVVSRPSVPVLVRVPVEATRVQTVSEDQHSTYDAEDTYNQGTYDQRNVNYDRTGASVRGIDSSSLTQENDQTRLSYSSPVNTRRPVIVREPNVGNANVATNVGGAKRYESSYSYEKEWEKHGSAPGGAGSVRRPVVVPAVIPVVNPDLAAAALNRDQLLVGGVELAGDRGSTTYNSGSRVANTGRQYSSQTYRENKGESARSSGYQTDERRTGGQAGYDVAPNLDLGASQASGAQASSAQTLPKSYQSSYSYHKSWEKHGTPYVIHPAGTGAVAGSATSDRYAGEASQYEDAEQAVDRQQSSRISANSRTSSASTSRGGRGQYESSSDGGQAALGSASHTVDMNAEMMRLQERMRNQMGQLCTSNCGPDGKTKGYSASYSYSSQRSYGGEEQNEGQHRYRRSFPRRDYGYEDLGQHQEDMGQQSEHWGGESHASHGAHNYRPASPGFQGGLTHDHHRYGAYSHRHHFGGYDQGYGHGRGIGDHSDCNHGHRRSDEDHRGHYVPREFTNSRADPEEYNAYRQPAIPVNPPFYIGVAAQPEIEKLDEIETKPEDLGQQTEDLGQLTEEIEPLTVHFNEPPPKYTTQDQLTHGLTVSSHTSGSEFGAISHSSQNINEQTEDLGQQVENLGQLTQSAPWSGAYFTSGKQFEGQETETPNRPPSSHSWSGSYSFTNAHQHGESHTLETHHTGQETEDLGQLTENFQLNPNGQYLSPQSHVSQESSGFTFGHAGQETETGQQLEITHGADVSGQSTVGGYNEDLSQNSFNGGIHQSYNRKPAQVENSYTGTLQVSNKKNTEEVEAHSSVFTQHHKDHTTDEKNEKSNENDDFDHIIKILNEIQKQSNIYGKENSGTPLNTASGQIDINAPNDKGFQQKDDKDDTQTNIEDLNSKETFVSPHKPIGKPSQDIPVDVDFLGLYKPRENAPSYNEGRPEPTYLNRPYDQENLHGHIDEKDIFTLNDDKPKILLAGSNLEKSTSSEIKPIYEVDSHKSEEDDKHWSEQNSFLDTYFHKPSERTTEVPRNEIHKLTPVTTEKVLIEEFPIEAEADLYDGGQQTQVVDWNVNEDLQQANFEQENVGQLTQELMPWNEGKLDLQQASQVEDLGQLTQEVGKWDRPQEEYQHASVHQEPDRGQLLVGKLDIRTDNGRHETPHSDKDKVQAPPQSLDGDLTTEKPGFWDKMKNAKDKAKSWFG